MPKYKMPYRLKGGLGGTQKMIVEAGNTTIAKEMVKGRLPPGAKITGSPTPSS